jgi:hypothetical protein
MPLRQPIRKKRQAVQLIMFVIFIRADYPRELHSALFRIPFHTTAPNTAVSRINSPRSPPHPRDRRPLPSSNTSGTISSVGAGCESAIAAPNPNIFCIPGHSVMPSAACNFIARIGTSSVANIAPLYSRVACRLAAAPCRV